LLVNATELALFEQILCAFGVAVADGMGSTVTVTTMVAPEHPADVGVMV
jgi:hypothetical protein